MSDHTHTEAVTPMPPPRGIFLPTMAWTTDRQQVGDEMQRLLRWRAQLNAVVNKAAGSDGCATWYLMAETSRNQLDGDIDTLMEWLATSQPETLEAHPTESHR
ncbi:hypothetical protein [Comamonas sp. wu1-DMT]|uniref:hypothetical protein n=1 Tax=Comamonas sp. wu1-DMT TaxID=3126390 RepID=UPI0032E506D9